MFDGLLKLIEAERSIPGSAVGKRFTAIYSCPFCNSTFNVGIVLYGNALDPDIGIRCDNCSKPSLIASNLANVKKIYRIINLANQAETPAEHIFVDSIAACAAIIIAADDVVLKEEVREFKDFCRNVFKNEESFDLAGERLKFYLGNIEKSWSAVQKLARLDSTAKRAIFELLFCLACSDGNFDSRENEQIERLAKAIQISEADLSAIREQFATSDQDEYAILGIARTDDFKLIKEAYRRKCLEFHPDRYQSLPESFQEFAKKQFQAVQQAYEKLRQRFENV